MADTSSGLSEERLRRFVKHVHKASKKEEQREKARKELERKVNRLKSLLSRKGVKKETIASALEDFDNKLNEVLKRENRILLRQEKDEMSTDKLKKEIGTIRESLSTVGKYDVGTIEMLKNQINELEKELILSEKSRIEQSDEMIDIIKSLKSRVDNMVDVRGKKIQELEEKIKSRVGKNYEELLKIEQQLRDMEEKYEAAKQAGIPEEKLGRFKEKMTVMKEQVGAKKAELEEPVEKPPFRVPKGTPMIEPQIEEKKKLEIPIMKRKPLIKHEMMFGEPPKAKPAVPAEEKMPAGIPPMPRIPKLGPSAKIPPPPPPPEFRKLEKVPRRKKGLFRRLVGK